MEALFIKGNAMKSQGNFFVGLYFWTKMYSYSLHFVNIIILNAFNLLHNPKTTVEEQEAYKQEVFLYSLGNCLSLEFYCEMAVFHNRRPGRRYIINFVKLICWLGWLTHVVFGQLDVSETVTGSVSFPDLGLTCIGNLAVFFTSFLRGRLDLEIGARDLMAILTGPKLKKINGINCFALTKRREGEAEGLNNCSVVMLSHETPNSSMAQFIKYIYNVYNVQSVILQCLRLDAEAHMVEACNCRDTESSRSNNIRKCGCIVFGRGIDVEIAVMLAERMPGTLKGLPDSLYLLPSGHCLRKGCHGCNRGLLYVETDQSGKKSFREDAPEVELSPTAACLTLDYISRESFLGGPATCICIPVHGTEWTRMLIRSFKPKDNETRGAIIRHAFSSVSDALENSMAGGGETHAKEEYNTASLIVPRLTEILINVVLTFWFKVDGFSSALVSRRAVKDYILDNRGSGFAAHVFISVVEVRSSSNANTTNFCQVLTFRANLLSLRTLSCIVGCGNLVCCVSWLVLVAMEGGGNKWYHTHSMAPSKPRVAVIAAAVAIALGMDCFDLNLYFRNIGFSKYRKKTLLLCGVIILEIMCIISGSAVAGVLGINFFGKWIYSAVQALVWVKWGIGSYLLGQYPPDYGGTTWWRGGGGMYMYSSAFMLNAILAGVRAKWQYSEL